MEWGILIWGFLTFETIGSATTHAAAFKRGEGGGQIVTAAILEAAAIFCLWQMIETVAH